MSAIKVQNKDEVKGIVSIENWANPRIWLMDFQISNGDFWPEYREDLEYLGIENY